MILVVSADVTRCLPLSGPYALVLLTGLSGNWQPRKNVRIIYLAQGSRNWMVGWGYSWVWHNCVHYLHYLLDPYKRNKYEIRVIFYHNPNMMKLEVNWLTIHCGVTSP